MLISELKEENKKIFILGINNISLNLIKFLNFNGISNISIWDTNEKIIEKFKNNHENKKIKIENINKINLKNIDYFIINKNIFLEKNEMSILIKQLDKIKEKVYIISEFLKEIFPNNIFIGLSGKTYKTITLSIIYNIIKDSKMNIINLSQGEEDIDYVDKEINIEINNGIFITEIFDFNYRYFKNMYFNFLVILDTQNNNIQEIINKKNIILNQLQTSTTIINIDAEGFKEIFENTILNNKDFHGKLIPISIKKILNESFSFINGTIYNYYNKNNISYDFIEMSTIKSDTKKICILSAYTICYLLNIENNFILEYLKMFKNQIGYLEFVRQINNVKFINNVFVNNDKCLIEPFENYNNVYPIFIINRTQDNIKEEINKFKRFTKNISIIDKFNLFPIEKKYNNIKIKNYSNLKNAILELYYIALKEDKAKEITILLTPLTSNNNNILYYNEYGEEFKNIINTL